MVTERLVGKKENTKELQKMCKSKLCLSEAHLEKKNNSIRNKVSKQGKKKKETKEN